MRSYLEDRFPHLIPGLTEHWGNRQAFKAFFFTLIFDTRGGRTGWPEEAWEELSFLEALHKRAYPTEEDPVNEREIHDDIKWVS
ncbi:MAG: hypothetical protein H6935_04420 [Thiobacillus sp.]|nr:hypothetical protein [Thiobacillus sp.]